MSHRLSSVVDLTQQQVASVHVTVLMQPPRSRHLALVQFICASASYCSGYSGGQVLTTEMTIFNHIVPTVRTILTNRNVYVKKNLLCREHMV